MHEPEIWHIAMTPPPNLNILSLPDELLVEIFEAVKTYRPANDAKHTSFASSAGDIASARLVCRRFAACSSHLLVHYIRIDGVTPESLERLEAISRHPLVSKGVHIVRLVPRFYTPRYADNLCAFAGHAVNTVFTSALRYREALEEEERLVDVDVARFSARRDECAEVIENVKGVLKTWCRASLDDQTEIATVPADVSSEKPDLEYTRLQRRDSDEGDELEEARNMQLLHLAHGLYRLRRQRQERLLQDGAFVHRFAAAMARMPRARDLEIHDFGPDEEEDADDDNYDNLLQDGQGRGVGALLGGDPYDGLLDIDFITQPSSWANATDRELGDPPAELLYRLPVAIQMAGARLDRIAIQTTTCAEHYFPLLRRAASPRDVSDLGTAISRMRPRKFIFLHRGDTNPLARVRTLIQEDVDAFDRMVAAMANSEALERLWVRLDGGGCGDGGWTSDGGLGPAPRMTLGSLLLPGPDPDLDSDSSGSSMACCWGLPACRSLRDVYLSDFALNLSDLKSFAAQLRDSGTRLDVLTLQRVHLVGGTWSEALEVLREVDVMWGKELMEPSGAECEDVMMMLGGRYDVVFGRLDDISSLAEEFINGEMKHNPLREDYTVEMEYTVTGEGVLIDITVGDQSDDVSGELEYEVPDEVSLAVSPSI